MQTAKQMMEKVSAELNSAEHAGIRCLTLKRPPLRHMIKLSLMSILQASLNRMGCSDTKVIELDDTYQIATVICANGKIGKLEAAMLLPE